MKLDLSKIKCAIFDLDGTLLDSTGVWRRVDDEFMGRRGLPVTPEFIEKIKVMNFKTGAEYVVREYGLDERPEDIVAEWFELARRAYAYDIILKPGAKEYLQKLSDAGIKLVVATSSDRALYEPCMKRLGIYDYFESFTQTDEVSRGKDYPDVYYEAARKAGVNKADCVVFEDVLRAVKSTTQAGFFTVAVSDAASLKDAGSIKQLADMYINDYMDLLDY